LSWIGGLAYAYGLFRKESLRLLINMQKINKDMLKDQFFKDILTIIKSMEKEVFQYR
jgi:hypothetical protein